MPARCPSPLALFFAALIGATVLGFPRDAAAVDPQRSFHRLVTSNGWGVASYDRLSRRVDTFLEHPYRFREPRNDAPDLCFQADESRDLAFDVYFGVRADGMGQWLTEAPLDRAGYVPGTNIIEAEQHAGPERALKVQTWTFMPTELEQPAVVLILRVENVSDSAILTSPYALFNFRLGAAGSGRDPSADNEQVGWDDARAAFYEYSDDSAGTMAIVALSPLGHATVSAGDDGVLSSLQGARDLDDVRTTVAPASDVVPGMQGPTALLDPGRATWMAVAHTWAADEDAGPDVDALRAWAGERSPAELLQAERAAWDAWHTDSPTGLTEEQELLWRQSAAVLRMGQVRDDAGGFGQILASLPPGLGHADAQWNISWVRDMAYATAALARSGHLEEARDALAFQVQAGPGRHEAEVGMPYRLSITRYFGNGAEESDCNGDGPNIEFDGFGLFLWSLGEYVRSGGDLETVRSWWPTIRSGIADVLLSLITDQGVVAADSSIWEVHWNGRQKRFTYTSLAGARGLCDAASIAEMLGEDADADRYGTAGARIRDAVVALHTDSRGAFAQSAEDLLSEHNYVDAATVEAINWGIVDPSGRIAAATIRALLDNLTVDTGTGIMRNDDGGWYDSQEWVFVDFRLIPALRAVGETERAQALLTWVEEQASRNDLQFSELHDATSGAYAGSIPMVGFGAGAYILALTADPLAAVCGEYAAEPDVPAATDAGLGDGGLGCEECPCSGADSPDGGPCTDAGSGCGCTVTRAAPLPAVALSLVLLGALVFRRRHR